MFWSQIYTADQLPFFGRQMFKNWPLKLGRIYQTAHQNDGFNALWPYPACLCYDSKPAKLHKAWWVIFSDCQNQASSHYFQKQSSTVTFILKFFSYRVRNLLNISSVFTELWRIQSWHQFHLHDARLLAGNFHKFELWFDFCIAKFLWLMYYQMRVLIGW